MTKSISVVRRSPVCLEDSICQDPVFPGIVVDTYDSGVKRNGQDCSHVSSNLKWEYSNFDDGLNYRSFHLRRARKPNDVNDP